MEKVKTKLDDLDKELARFHTENEDLWNNMQNGVENKLSQGDTELLEHIQEVLGSVLGKIHYIEMLYNVKSVIYSH